MRQNSVGVLRTKVGQGNTKDRPDPSTKIGKLLGALMSGDLVPAKTMLGCNPASYIEYLRSAYGMEIESKGGRGGGCRLLGEWDGPYFVPIERMDPYPPLPED
jgi:hypothetical protein